ncbi:MAG: BrnT family toxin [Elusimicrobia bacterium]|nr:BrnT family toxin [Elusimicrobiota bacterium]
MKLSPDPEAEGWLERFGALSDDFDWDGGNRDKNLKHGVTDAEVESLFECPTVFMGRIIEPRADEWRGLLLGKDSQDRLVALIFTIRDKQLRPISCRPMRAQEKTKYEEETR